MSRTRLAAFKVPRDLHIVEELPRNATGKILKAELRRLARQDPPVQPARPEVLLEAQPVTGRGQRLRRQPAQMLPALPSRPAASASATPAQAPGPRGSTASEWIAEAPSGSSGVYSLSNFHSWFTSGASVTSGSSGTISTFPDDELTMINNSGSVKAQPGSLGGGGSSFTVTWERSS